MINQVVAEKSTQHQVSRDKSQMSKQHRLKAQKRVMSTSPELNNSNHAEYPVKHNTSNFAKEVNPKIQIKAEKAGAAREDGGEQTPSSKRKLSTYQESKSTTMNSAYCSKKVTKKLFSSAI